MPAKGYKLTPEERLKKSEYDKRYVAKNREKVREWASAQYKRDKAAGITRGSISLGRPRFRPQPLTIIQGQFVVAFD